MRTAIIRENECIGCSRCIPACPVDAILGTNKFLHTVLLDECIGCGLCVAPCPVDCIEMVELQTMLPPGEDIQKALRGQRAKQRHKARQLRLKQQAQQQIPVFVDPAQRQAHIKMDLEKILKRTQSKNNASNNSQ